VICLDLDVLDCAVMPAVAYPSPGGLSFLQLADLIAGIAAKARIGGFAMVEFVPAQGPLRCSPPSPPDASLMHVLHQVARQVRTRS
jgi:hypothetical protein